MTGPVAPDVAYVLRKLANGRPEERGDALAMLADDPTLYPPAERLLRVLVFQENDLFLRERMIDALAQMAVYRLWGGEQVSQFGVRRVAQAEGYRIPPAPPANDPSVLVFERLIHENNAYIVAHARAARARLGIRAGLWGLILSLEDRDTYPEIADLSLQLLRQDTGLHMSGDAADWWDLYERYSVGAHFRDPKFASRSAHEAGL
ncbi:MAG: hypothetical protein ACREJ2_17955 [Planctomycetota bacterium]